MLLPCNCHNCKIKTTMKQPSRIFLSQLLVPQNFKAVDHVPCTLGCLVTCLVFNFTTFLPNAFLSLVACRCISSGVKFFTQITRSFLFPKHVAKDSLNKLRTILRDMKHTGMHA